MASTKMPYEILGVTSSASSAEIKNAYRNLAKKYHPDLNTGNKDAEKNFKEINSAIEMIGTPEVRVKLDWGELDAQQAHSSHTASGGAKAPSIIKPSKLGGATVLPSREWTTTFFSPSLDEWGAILETWLEPSYEAKKRQNELKPAVQNLSVLDVSGIVSDHAKVRYASQIQAGPSCVALDEETPHVYVGDEEFSNSIMGQNVQFRENDLGGFKSRREGGPKVKFVSQGDSAKSNTDYLWTDGISQCIGVIIKNHTQGISAVIHADNAWDLDVSLGVNLKALGFNPVDKVSIVTVL